MEAPPIEVTVRPPLPFMRNGSVSICIPRELDTFSDNEKAIISHMIILGAKSAMQRGRVLGFVAGSAVSFVLFWLASNGWSI